MGSKVAKKLGDGLMALVDYPLAQENESGMAGRPMALIESFLQA